MYNELEIYHKKVQRQYLENQIIKIRFNRLELPVNPAASEAKNVLYDINTKSVVSKSGKSRM
jgi:hypothetical protein